MTVGIIVTPGNSPAALCRAVSALGRQLRAGDDFIVPVPPWDTETRAALASLGAPVRIVDVYLRGAIHGSNAGLSVCSTDVAVFISANAEAPFDWVERIRRRFSEVRTGIVMGPVVRPAGCEVEPGCGMALLRRLIGGFASGCSCEHGRFEEQAALEVKKQGYEVVCDPALALILKAEDGTGGQAGAGHGAGGTLRAAARLLGEWSHRSRPCVSQRLAQCSAAQRRHCAGGEGAPQTGCVLDPRPTAT